MDRKLKQLAQSIREQILEMGLSSVLVNVIQNMRRTGLPLKTIPEATGLQRGAVYVTCEKKPNEVVKPRPYNGFLTLF